MSLRSATLYVSSGTARDCQTAAQLAGVASGDDWAEMVLREALDATPGIPELQRAISKAIKDARAEWQEAHQPSAPTPATLAREAIRSAQT